ncbi:MAG: electron transfer flavoprotein subunit alpha/FixB family protein [bacterium]|nr:electron transfer flavoprotein subunit alpha/FixB family protein [bacterium]MDE0288666.1 electron transfer flavoprotein subunit alpha/FixB family protein [bacterium]MDE0439598.1 electron transfer flavoprotein subunit alpha/FixB family protein [bacterium]
MSVFLYLVEHDRGLIEETTMGGLTGARHLAETMGAQLHTAVIGEGADRSAGGLAAYGAEAIHLVRHGLLTDYGPDAWADSLAQLAGSVGATAVVATGTDRGNEVMAHVGARMDLAMVANCLEIESEGDDWLMTRVRWGGSLHERARLAAHTKLVTLAPHSTEAARAADRGAGHVAEFVPVLDDSAAVTMVKDRVTVSEGITLATAPVVVSGGRGVGSVEGFAIIEELADLLGGAVGCSRVVTNNGWKNHKFQVGQTGTVVAPDLYIACGISGAIQHWVGMMSAKNILAINIDPDAPMVTKADWAVIADLHEVVPAISAEITRRRGLARERG